MSHFSLNVISISHDFIISLFQTVLRIWDCLFYEGSKIIFRVCLTLIKRNQVSILQCNDLSSLAECFKEITRDSLVIQCHDFMQVTVLLVHFPYFTGTYLLSICVCVCAPTNKF
jgi:hypothetical protein